MADYLSRLVKSYMIDDVISNKNIPEVAKDAAIISMLHHEMKVPDEDWVKIKDVHNDIAELSGVEATMAKLVKAHKPWVYICTDMRCLSENVYYTNGNRFHTIFSSNICTYGTTKHKLYRANQ